jgi:transcriptional regulator with XRE-family HTH domain
VPRSRARMQDTDRHIGARIRKRRIMVGLTQRQMAQLIGISVQQAHMYEKGTNRVTAGRLYSIAQALGVEVTYFYEGLPTTGPSAPSPQRWMFEDLARAYLNIPVQEHREAILALARALANDETGHAAPPATRPISDRDCLGRGGQPGTRRCAW